MYYPEYSNSGMNGVMCVVEHMFITSQKETNE